MLNEVVSRIQDIMSWKEGDLLFRTLDNGKVDTAVIASIDKAKETITLYMPNGDERVLTFAYCVRTNWSRHAPTDSTASGAGGNGQQQDQDCPDLPPPVLL